MAWQSLQLRLCWRGWCRGILQASAAWLTASTTCSKARTCHRWRSSRCSSPSSVSSRTPVRFPRRSSRTSAPPRATSSSPTSYSSEFLLWFFPQGLQRGLPDAPRGFPHLPGLRPSPTSNSSEFLLWLYPQGLQRGLPGAPQGFPYLPALSLPLRLLTQVSLSCGCFNMCEAFSSCQLLP